MKKFLKAISLLFFMSSVVAGFNYLIISNNESVAKAKEEYIPCFLKNAFAALRLAGVLTPRNSKRPLM